MIFSKTIRLHEGMSSLSYQSQRFTVKNRLLPHTRYTVLLAGPEGGIFC